MGVSAAVVYDIVKNSTIVLRTPTSSRKQRHEILDTIASFSQHCQSVRGVAQSVTEVSALWGGPPYVTYNVIASRFRVIIIWDEGSSDINVSYDVYHAIVRLQDVVSSSTEALIQRDTSALMHVYEEAGHAVCPDEPFILPISNPNASTRSKPLLSLPSRRTSTASDTSSKKSFFGKIGAALKTSTGQNRDKKADPSTSQQSIPDTPSKVFGPGIGYDDEEGPLVLPDDVFEWCYFGAPIPEDDPGNLDWFAHFFQPQHSFVAPNPTSNSLKPAYPALRAGSTSSTPLTVPSSSTSLPAQPKVSNTNAPLPPVIPLDQKQQTNQDKPAPASVTSPAENRNTPSVQPSPAQISSAQVSSGQASASSVTASKERAGASLPEVNSAQAKQSSASQTPSPGTATSFDSIQQQQQTIQEQLLIKRQQLLQQKLQQQQQQQQQMLSPQNLQMQSPQLIQRQQQQQLQQSQTQVQSVQSPSSLSAQNTNLTSPNDGIPEALKQNNEDDFDVAQLGGYKDKATSTLQALTDGDDSILTSDVKKLEDDAIRARMNEFAHSMQSGNFTVALRQVYDSLRFLCRIEPRRIRETVTCANYVLAQKLLLRNATLESELAQPIIVNTPAAVMQRQVECALLTMFLAELKHLLPRHRVAAMRVAVEKNMQVGNFGMCARWLKQLIEKAPPNQKAILMTQLQTCVTNGERNAHMPPTNRLCYTTLRVLTSPYGACDVCPAVYHASLSGAAAGQACDTCFVGTISTRS